MVYDWVYTSAGVTPYMSCSDGGIAYAWADKPEGPFHRATKPILRLSTSTALLGKYVRSYAATLIRRKKDWLILGMLDGGAWAMFAITSPHPEGPYSERVLVRNVESDCFHPPLMEGYPAFAHEGYVYAPMTSVALNRNFNTIFRVPIERATEPAAWEVFRHGSVWHAEDVEHEARGLWGQTFSGQVDAAGTLWAMFTGLDSKNGARSIWRNGPGDKPLRDRGFVLSGHEGASLTCLRPAFKSFNLDATLRVRGTARLFWDFHAAAGPNLTADATLHPLTRTRHQAVELSPTTWKVISVDAKGQTATLASGSVAQRPKWLLSLQRKPDGATVLAANGETLWTGAARRCRASGRHDWFAGRAAQLSGGRSISGRRSAGQGSLHYLYTDALLGTGEKAADWQERSGPEFRYGVGAISRSQGTRQVECRRIAIHPLDGEQPFDVKKSDPGQQKLGRIEALDAKCDRNAGYVQAGCIWFAYREPWMIAGPANTRP